MTLGEGEEVKGKSQGRSRTKVGPFYSHFIFTIFGGKNRAVYELTWKNIVKWGRPKMAT